MSKLPAVRPRQVVSALKRAGFIEHHQKGGHLFLWNPQSKRMTTVPQHPGDLRMGTLRAIIEQSGLTQQQFVDLL
jgi:predicted RNA binding protein YcfA (HicA-like mRNA interferase family)